MSKLEAYLIDCLETYILEELADGEWNDDNREEVIDKYWDQAIEELKIIVGRY
jgi:hypothetical protein